MKCRYDLTRQCTVDCEKIRACAWMADENRIKRLGVGAASAGEGKHVEKEIRK